METCRQIDIIQWEQDCLYFKFTNQISQNRKQVAVWSVSVFFLCVCVFFISIMRTVWSQTVFFSVFWMQQSITSPYFLKLLPICTGGRSHFFSLNLRASLVPAAFVKKKRIGLCFTDANMWPSKISNGPPKNRKGAKHCPQNYWPGDNTEPSLKDILPSKIWSLYKEMGPPISMMGPPSYSKLSPKDPQTFNLV